ncbi:hypothetical protein GQR58_008209 [Nymphon striatum]|nr:hypothetical protein GQR58_008209 [Nymphon striatum]
MISKLYNNHSSAFAMPELVKKDTSFVLLVHLIHVFQADQDVTIENFFMYLENPPAPCSKIVKLGGIPCKGLNGINTTDGDKIVCENPAKPIPHRNCIIYSLG